MKYYYVVYKTTNLSNGMIYVGVHKTLNLSDKYLGSGKLLKRAVKKYGKDNFVKENIAVFDNVDFMFDMEARIVNEKFLKDENTYNLAKGGRTGYPGWKNDEKQRRESSERMKKLFADGKVPSGSFKGKHHTAESKRKMGKANSVHQNGSGNSQYGTCWIFLEKTNKKIKKEDLDDWLAKGWEKGRRIKPQG